MEIFFEIKSNSNSYLQSPLIRSSPDINKAISDLGWVPSTSAKLGFKKTIESFYEIASNI